MMAAEGQNLRPVVIFDPPIVVENDFCTLACSKMTVPENRSGLNAAWCRTPLTQLFSLVINQLEEKLDARYRKTPWPQALKDNPFLQAYFEAFLDNQMAAALSDVLDNSPEGVNIASKAFCWRNSKYRIRSLLEVMASELGINIGDVVEEKAGEIIINFSKLPKEHLDQLRHEYFTRFGSHWMSMLHTELAFDLLSMSAPMRRTENCLFFYVEGQTLLDDPDIFMLETDLAMKPFSGTLSLKDICVNNVAEGLYSRWEETREDQEASITVEALEVPATLLPAITEKYRHFKEKVQDFFEQVDEFLGEELSSSDDQEDSDESDEEGDDDVADAVRRLLLNCI